MSKKKDRAWFVCPQWGELVSQHYGSDTAVGQALNAHPKVLANLRAGTPVPKSTVLKMLRRLRSQRDLGAALGDLVVDTRSR
jgi:cellulose synthase/poly-beta-1,6-N-acetylglucosamine synthase-like glycosyltransferase